MGYLTIYIPDSLEKTLMLGGIGGRRRRLDGITDSMDVSLSELRELVLAFCDSWGHRVGHN